MHVKDMQQHLEGLDEAKKKSISFVIVCAGSTEGARFWKEKTGITQYPVLADPKHEFLETFKFPRSTWNTCRPWYGRNVFFVTKREAPGKTVADRLGEVVMPDQTHDTHQMGGTIVMSPEGKILYLHQTTTSFDRPPAAKVFASIP